MARNDDDLDRRDALKLIAGGLGLAALGAEAVACAPTVRAASSEPRRSAAPAPDRFLAAPPMDTVRIGFVGVGGMGSAHVRNLLRVEGCVIKAVDDIVPEKVTRILDLVYNATPWEWHVPICLAAMRNGKHAVTEVPAAYTVDDCWALVEHAETHGKHCIMMENCTYGRMEMMVFNMVRQGVFGEILHGEGGYLHDLRSVKFSPEGEGLWRRAHAMQRNGNLYPTHGLGPVANCLDINRGDRFVSLVSMSSPSRGLQLYAREHFPDGSAQRQERYVLGDVNWSLIMTANGRTICVGHDTNLPRPYSRVHVVQGTRGLFQGYPDRVYIEGRSKSDEWEPAEAYLAEFDHPLWKQMEEKSRGAGHGGMDYLEDYRLIKCLREGLPTDMNVYDAVAISAVTPLSEWSVANGSRPAEFPDFTRGRWKTWPRLGIVTA